MMHVANIDHRQHKPNKLPIGSEVRSLVLKAMRKALKAKRINLGQWVAAQAVVWPETTPRILGDSLKVQKGRLVGYETAVIYLAPAVESVAYGGEDTCFGRSKGCTIACLGHRSDRLRMFSGANAKAWKTLLWIYRRDIFETLLRREVYNLRNRAIHAGLTPAVRFNGSSDYAIEVLIPDVIASLPDVVWYDYTKLATRAMPKRKRPANYHLTFSRSEDNGRAVLRVLRAGGNVAVVFTDLAKAMRTGWKGYRVIDGDETDARPTDDSGVIVGLSPKAKVKDDSGFFVHN